MNCEDPKCALHGGVKTRGTHLSGVVVSAQAKKTAIIQIDYTRYMHKYERYLRKRSRIAAHNPDCISAKVGDIVDLAETRKLSKTKAYAIVNVSKPKASP